MSVGCPLNVVISLYATQSPFPIASIETIPLSVQLQSLRLKSLSTPNDRRLSVDSFKNIELSQSPYKRLRLLHILSEFYKDWYLLKDNHFKPLSEWTPKDLSLHAIIYFLNLPENKIQTENEKQLNKLSITWKFVDFLRQFFKAKGYTGQAFVNEYSMGVNNKIGSGNKTGFGLAIVKAVCKQFSQKTGQFTKVKKNVSEWVKIAMARDSDEKTFKPLSADSMKQLISAAKNALEVENYQVVNSEPNAGNSMSNNNMMSNGLGSSAPNNEKWYWFCDDRNGIEWIPYSDAHQKAVNNAWNNNMPSVMVGKYKIEFNRDNSQGGQPSGRQKNTTIHDAWYRDVIRGRPDHNSLINSVQCRDNPM